MSIRKRDTATGADVLRLGKPEPDGRFHIEGLIPGLSFASVNSGDFIRFVTLDGHHQERNFSDSNSRESQKEIQCFSNHGSTKTKKKQKGQAL